MDNADTAKLLMPLSGTACKVLLGLICLGRSVSAVEVADVAGVSRQSAASALRRLGTLGLVQDHGHGAGQWALTVSARQFILGEVGLVLDGSDVKALDVKNFNVATGSSSTHDHELTDELGSTTYSDDVKFFNIADGYEEAVAALVAAGVAETLPSGKGARDSVVYAIERGWSPDEALECVEGWLAHAKTQAGEWIKFPCAYAAYALREGKRPPVREHDSSYYISGEYADIIKH